MIDVVFEVFSTEFVFVVVLLMLAILYFLLSRKDLVKVSAWHFLRPRILSCQHSSRSCLDLVVVTLLGQKRLHSSRLESIVMFHCPGLMASSLLF